jgi:hypothetical protein
MDATSKIAAGLTKGLATSIPDLTKLDLTAPIGEHLTYPSGIYDIDDSAGYAFSGGFYAASVLAGYPKLGKTLTASRSAVLAVCDGWKALYFSGENTRTIFYENVSNVLEVKETNDWPDVIHERLDFFKWNLSTTLTTINDEILKWNMAPAELGMPSKTLVVIDSLNYLAENEAATHKGLSYFNAIRKIMHWAVIASDESEGLVSFLILSEVGRTGGVKGQSPEYVANGIILTLRGAGQRTRVNVDVWARESPSADCGEYIRIHNRCELRPARLVVVQGGQQA